MTIRSVPGRLAIRPARTAEEIDAVLRGRHRVYCEESTYLPRTPDGRILDRFDAYPDTTVHLLAEVDGSVVGGVRFCRQAHRIGLPVDEFFDFTPHVRTSDRLACGGMLFVTRAAGRNGIGTELIRVGEDYAARWAASVLVGTVNPMIEPLFGLLGYQPVGHPDRHGNGLPFVPVVKRLDEVGIHRVGANGHSDADTVEARRPRPSRRPAGQ
jgi:N-acyl-L-homoserine lactone synthetase